MLSSYLFAGGDSAADVFLFFFFPADVDVVVAAVVRGRGRESVTALLG